ncbi:hypothetical protein TNCV_4756071 [Trichonephila clavipes]|nr:hypothetical protein TNCV_4756071 [Trichonephila clavipes]
MYHDEIPERCKLNFTGIVDDALRIATELFPKQTLKKNTLERKLKLTPTDGCPTIQARLFKISPEDPEDLIFSDEAVEVVKAVFDSFYQSAHHVHANNNNDK